jgi:FkbM family methyltransferase
MNYKIINDIFIPTNSAEEWRAHLEEELWKEPAERVLKHVDTLGVCVQAGGNIGLYPSFYAKHFDVVYTFEPEPLNFFCLSNNVKELNVIKTQACLGNNRKYVSLETPKQDNCGTHRVDGEGIIPTTTIDNMRLNACDLIHLDIEGYEMFALQGAVKTINRYKPVVCIEMNRAFKKYNIKERGVYNLMASLDYYPKEQIYNDVVFVNSDKPFDLNGGEDEE